MRRVLILALVVVAGCGGEPRQDADEPEGEFKVEVVDASFPRAQQVASGVELKLKVRNGEQDRALRNVAVTVETRPRQEGDSALAFGQNVRDAGLSDAGRPVWVLDEGPSGQVATVDTWSAGELAPGEERELTWKVVPARTGTYELRYRVAPGLTGRARAAEGRTEGRFRVVIDSEPVPARVGADGEVERGS